MKNFFEENYIPEPNSGCWLWIKSFRPSGYGRFFLDNKTFGAHRFSWSLVNGPIPKGKQINHTCDVKSCVNPQHLYPGTQLDNMRDAKARKRCHNQNVVTCPKGHPYNYENTYVDRQGYRFCKKCKLRATDLIQKARAFSRII